MLGALIAAAGLSRTAAEPHTDGSPGKVGFAAAGTAAPQSTIDVREKFKETAVASVPEDKLRCCCCSTCDYSHDQAVTTEGIVAAATKGDLHFIRHAVCMLGADIMNQRDEDGMTALHIASQKNHMPVLKFLLEAVNETGINPGVCRGTNATLPSRETRVEHVACTLCSQSESCNHEGASLLDSQQKSHLASFSSCISSPPYSSPSLMSQPLETVCQPTGSAQNTAGRENVFTSNTATARVASRQGTSVSSTATSGSPSIHPPAGDDINDSGADQSASSSTTGSTVSSSGSNTSILAASFASASKSSLLVKQFPDALPLHQPLQTKLDYTGHLEQQKFLASSSDELSASSPWTRSTSNRGHTALHWAALKGHYSAVIELLRHGFDVDAKSLQSATPLQLAVAAEKGEVLRALVKRGADINARTTSGSFPAKVAAHLGNLEIIEALCAAGGLDRPS